MELRLKLSGMFFETNCRCYCSTAMHAVLLTHCHNITSMPPLDRNIRGSGMGDAFARLGRRLRYPAPAGYWQ